ncbi:Metallo-peptidase family M12-domain-containing protein [Aspergillus cavernicola]|uniref:Metallo-peptidase family M12-domain-containing protein n=1 Tax=Aspergillus cavernicola TaxID=176166 RepID=A0ABR4I9T4_9EURO
MRNLYEFVAFLAHYALAAPAAGLFDGAPFQLSIPVINTPSHIIAGRSQFNITAGIDGRDQQVAFVLEPNRDLIAQGIRIRYLDSSRNSEDAGSNTNLPYHITKGAVWTKLPGQPWDDVGWARLIITRAGTNPLFEGTFTLLSEQYEIRPQSQNGDSGSSEKEQLSVYPISAANSTDISPEELGLHKAGCMTTMRPGLNKRQTWFNDYNTTDSNGGSSGCSATRQIAYIGVAIDCSHRAVFDSDDDVKRNIISVVNTASVVFENSFNVALALRDVMISNTDCSSNASTTDQWDVPCSSGDLNWRLNQFTAWRATVEDDNAYWTLMTGCAPAVGEIGVSWVGEVCKSGEGYEGLGSGIGANIVGHSNTEWQVFAHESAHMFGAIHDCDSDACASNLDSSWECCPMSSSTCDAEEYLMDPTAGKGMTRFSPCTIGSVCSKIGHGDVNTQCLVSGEDVDELEEEVNLPDGQCGNGVVEDGEACDCGRESCDESEARCCDMTTCQWRDEGRCALSEEDDGGFSSWLREHKPLFIGLCAGIGGSLLLLVALLIFFFIYRK